MPHYTLRSGVRTTTHTAYCPVCRRPHIFATDPGPVDTLRQMCCGLAHRRQALTHWEPIRTAWVALRHAWRQRHPHQLLPEDVSDDLIRQAMDAAVERSSPVV